MKARSSNPASTNWGLARKTAKAKILAVSLMVGVLCTSFLIEIDGALVANAKVSVPFKRQIVQHEIGGEIATIGIRDGQDVEVGDELFQLESTETLSNLKFLRFKLESARVKNARARAEFAGHDKVVFPELSTVSPDIDLDLQQVINDELQLFQLNSEIYNQRLAHLRKKVRHSNEKEYHLRNQLEILQSQIDAAHGTQIMFDELATRGLAGNFEIAQAKDAVRTNKRKFEELKTAILENASARYQYLEEIRMMPLSRAKDASSELTELAKELSDISAAIRQNELELASHTVLAPFSGKAILSSIVTPGMVIRPGQDLVEIVPQGRELEIVTRVSPSDVAQLSLGQTVKVEFVGTERRPEQKFEGHVTYISADAIELSSNGISFFEVIVSMENDEKLSEVKKIPGTPAVAFFLTKRRTIAQYLTEPIKVFFGRSLREA